VVKKHIPAGLGWAGGGARRLCFRRNGSKKQKAERSTINGKPESQSGRSLIAIGGPILALLAALALPLAAQDFVFNNGTEPQSLDPALITGIPESRISYALFEGLTVNDAQTGLPVPGLASSWTVSRDLRTYTFTLRDTTWSDGTPLTAQDVVDAWLRVLNPKTASQYAYLLGDNIAGADAFLKGQGPADHVQIHAPDRHTFVVTFVGPLPYALAMLAHNAFMVTPTFAVNRFGPGEWTKPAHFIGNGPYVLKTWRPQDQIVVVKNPRYWDAANIKLHTITYLTIEDQNVAFDKYRAGEIDYVPDDSIPVGRIDEIRLRKDYHHQPSSSIYYYTFNVTRKPFDDVRVRKALSMAVNREELVRQVLKAGDVATAGFVPPMGGFATTRGNGFDPDQARRLLAQAGYPGGRGFPKITFTYNTSARHKLVCEWVQQQWQSILGIDMDLHNLEWNTFLDTKQKTHDFQIARAGWVADYLDPSNYLDMFKSRAGNNDGLYSNKRYDALLGRAATMPAGPARNQVLEQAEDILVTQDQAVIPFFFYVTRFILDDRKWGGICLNTIDIHQPRWWYPK
jgi:oligopeptide transport system substrate-binding protein